MQKIQPEIQKIREKFKDDQARLQKETMDLFRRTGANPLEDVYRCFCNASIFRFLSSSL